VRDDGAGMTLRDVGEGVALFCGFVGVLVAIRMLVVLAYLPFHLALNRKGVPMPARESGMLWVGLAPRILAMLYAVLFFVFVIL